MRSETGPTIYKKDKNGNIREWSARAYERDDKVTFFKVTYGIVGQTQERKTEENNFEEAVSKLRTAYDKRYEDGYRENEDELDSCEALKKPMKFAQYNYEYKPPMFSVQPMLDGIRCLYSIEHNKLYSKSGKEYALPAIHDEVRQLAKLVGNDLDGYLVLHNHSIPAIIDAVKDFKDTLRNDIKYVVNDIISSEHYKNRIGRLEQCFIDFKENRKHVSINPSYCVTWPKDLNDMHEYFKTLGHIGVVIRDWNRGYTPGETSDVDFVWPFTTRKAVKPIHVVYPKINYRGQIKYLVEFICKDDNGTRFTAIPGWSVEEMDRFYQANRSRPPHEVCGGVPELLLEYSEDGERVRYSIGFVDKDYY